MRWIQSAIHRLSAVVRLTPSVRFFFGSLSYCAGGIESSTADALRRASATLLRQHLVGYASPMTIQHTPRLSRLEIRFPNCIREYRLKAGLSQRKLAGMLGRSKDAVSSWERGLNLPSVPLLMRMAKILGTLAESLYRDFYDTFRPEETANPSNE